MPTSPCFLVSQKEAACIPAGSNKYNQTGACENQAIAARNFI